MPSLKFRLALCAALAISCMCVLAVWSAARQHGVPGDRGWFAQPIDDVWFVTDVPARGPAAGKLEVGDKILAVDGRKYGTQLGPDRVLTGVSLGDTYSVEAERHGARVQVRLTIWRRPDARWQTYSYLLLALINLAVALWIGLARPGFDTAQLGSLMFLGAAQTFLTAVLGDFQNSLSGPALTIAVLFASMAWRPLEWAVAYDFASRFPEPVAESRFWRALRVLLYAAAFFLFALGLPPLLADLLNLSARSALLPHWFPLAAFDRSLPYLRDILGALALLSMPFVLRRNYRKLRDPSARKRLRWAALGLSFAAIPIAIEISARVVLRLLENEQAAIRVLPVLDLGASVLSAFAPITMAYAIVRHRVLGIRLVIRRGVQYLLAKNVLRLILYTPLILITADVLLHPQRPLQDFLLHRSWWFYLFFIGSAAMSLRFSNQLRLWVDRKFFRSAYEQETILAALIERMQACENMDEIARTMAQELESTLHPSRIFILYRKEPTRLFTVGYGTDAAAALQFRGIMNEGLEDAAQNHKSARTFSELTAALQERDPSWKAELAGMLVVPIGRNERELLGLLLLARKKSEELYSNRDQKFLQAVAAQMALVFEVISLKERVREEGRIRVDVLGRLDQQSVQLIAECPVCGRCYTTAATQCEADGAQLGLTLPIERIIEGKYRLERRIGAGGMGAVFEASDLRLDRTVAVKVMMGRLFGNTAALRRFEREARTAARLDHPNIVAIYDFGALRGDGAYLVMQYVRGRSWREEMERAGHIPPSRAAHWFDQLCDALASAHASGVIHRDLKPENVLVSEVNEEADRVTVLDFGLAKVRPEERFGPTNSTTDAVAGTYGYMSPEQRRCEPVDTRADIYALGVLVVEVLSHRRPPLSGASHEWMHNVLRWPTAARSASQLKLLLERCLQEDVAKRISRVQTVRDELVPLLLDCPAPLRTNVKVAAGGAETTARDS
jgi:eukaryotic-like serine/threonine-protein kinase